MATTIALAAKTGPLDAYLGLARPKAVLPHLVTAAAAMFLAAEGAPPATTLLLTLAGGGCVAAAANTFNSYLDRDIDALMARTSRRPLPLGLVRPDEALAFGMLLGLVGVIVLGAFVDWLAAALAVEALAYYVVPYTLWLKRRTPWSAIVGSGAGANPPLIGWVVITHRVTATPLLLAAIIILWTIPHFWTLAIYRHEDYARAGLEVLPKRGATAWIAICAALVVAASLTLAPAAGLGLLYASAAAILGAGLLYLALRVGRSASPVAARRLYGYSVLYIALLFGAMIADRAH